MTTAKFKIVAVILTVSFVFFLFWYLFRVEMRDNPAIGMIYYKYRWGLPDMILADTNRDGKVDARASVRDSGSFEANPHIYWEDRDFDGVFEIKIYTKDDIYILWIDANKDGVYDTELQGEEAHLYYRSLSSTAHPE